MKARPPTQQRGLGILLLLAALAFGAGVAPNLGEGTKQFIFERPPDAPTWSFSPPIIVGIIAAVVGAAGLATLVRPGHRISRALLLASAASLIPLSVSVSLALSDRSSTNVTSLAVQSLFLGTPVALGAMSGLWCERSGVVNIGIEGMMLTAAGVGFMTYALLGDANSTPLLWFSVVIAVAAASLVALLHALVSVTFRVDQIVSGVVINLFAAGLTGFLLSEVINPHGISTGTGTTEIALPGLSAIPILGDQLFTLPPLHLLMFIVVTASWFVLFHTRFGLRVRAVGEHPHAAETLGIDPIRVRYTSVLIGGALAGLGGAWFALEASTGFNANITGGKGFIALAALIFGKWRPFGAFAGAMLFGFTTALSTTMQSLDVTVGEFVVPAPFINSLPFLLTILVVAGAVGRAVPPAADGAPYERSR